MRTRLLSLIFLIPVLLLAACGDDDSDSGGGGGGGDGDEAAITKVLQDGLTSSDPKVVCGGSLSTDLISRIYGDEAKCETVEKKDAADNDQAEKVDVSGVEVDGDTAKATVALTGGTNDGARGDIDLAKQGDDWRVKELSAGFLRSQLETGLKNDSTDLPKEVADCLGKKLLDLDDAELQKVAYGAIGETDEAQQQLEGYATECATQAGGDAGGSDDSGGSGSGGGDENVGFIRKKFEEGVAGSLEKQGASEKEIQCVKEELRKRISDDDLSKAIGQSNGGKDIPESVNKAATQAILECGAVGS